MLFYGIELIPLFPYLIAGLLKKGTCLLNIFLHIYLLRRKANDLSPYILPEKTTNQNVRFISQHGENVDLYFAGKI